VTTESTFTAKMSPQTGDQLLPSRPGDEHTFLVISSSERGGQ
jgi:hypothetical protein